jgi:hypothetical protein
MENRLTPKEMVEKFLRDTEEARALSQKCRDYHDHKQWTEREIGILAARKQAPIVVNRIKPKVEGLLGLYELRKSDPKAYPRTKKHEKASHVITDALRYVADKNNFQMIRLDVAEDFFVEGYGGVFIGVKQKGRSIEVEQSHIHWDRIIYDPHSRKKDFSDARYKGLLIWMDKADIVDNWPGVRLEDLEAHGNDYETTEDRPRWTDDNNRARICQLFYLEKGKWKMCVFSGDTVLVEASDSPYLDDEGLPTCPIELVSANVGSNNERYGEVAGFLSQQDEINHRRSKFLHQNSTRQTFGNDNAIQDVASAKAELRNPEGHLKINGDAQFGKDFGVIPTGDMSSAQYQLYLDAKAEMDRSSFNAPLGGETADRDLSGRALDKLQQGATLELNRQYALLANFEKRVHEQTWARIKQFWKEEKWIRVTDDQENLRWIGLNAQITGQQFLEDAIADKSAPLEQRQEAEKILQFLVQTQNPRLQQVVEVKNDVAAIDIDIVIDQSADVVNVQQEQFQLLVQFAQKQDLDIIEILELSQLRGKEELIQKIERRRAEQAQANAAANQQDQMITEMERVAKVRKDVALTENIGADTIEKRMNAITKQIENNMLVNAPDKEPQVSV